MKTTQALLCGALALSPLAARAGVATTYSTADKTTAPTQPPAEPCAGPISYSNLELLYAYTELDDNFFGDDGMHGGRINLEWGVFQSFYLTAGAEFTGEGDLNLWIVNGGIGTYFAVSDNLHVAVDGGVLWADVDYEGDDLLPFEGDFGESETGWYIRPHLRGKWGCFEVHAGALYRDVDYHSTPVIVDEVLVDDDDDGSWAGFAKVFYHLNDSWDLTGGVLVDEDVTQWTAGVRWRF